MNPVLVLPVVYIANHWSQTIPLQQEDRSKHMKTVANATKRPNITGGNYVQTHQMSHVVNE